MTKSINTKITYILFLGCVFCISQPKIQFAKIRLAPIFERNYKALNKKYYDMDWFLTCYISQDTK